MIQNALKAFDLFLQQNREALHEIINKTMISKGNFSNKTLDVYA